MTAHDRRGAEAIDVVLVVMPFADVRRPALGVSLLRSAAVAAGFSTHVEYLNLRMADLVGAELYGLLSDLWPADLLVGEWVFAADVFGDAIPPEHDFVADVLRRVAPPDVIASLRRLRAGVGAWLDEVTTLVAARSPTVVGFTSTFHQTCPSLAVARRLKALPDPPLIVFGGANCEGEMGEQLLRSFPWVDVVCSGESDLSFPALLRRELAGDDVGAIPGVVDRRGGASPPPMPIENLDALPYPDYDDYFDQREASTLAGGDEGGARPRQVVVETARGCWWGARRHCTFCGLNGQTMAYRSKSPERAYAEITDLCRRYGTGYVSCVDNILDPTYIDTLFPRLATSGLGLDLFYEVKANLRYDQLVKLKAAGVNAIQPGIESLSDEVLRLMRKGVTGFQNLQLMRWCDELGIDCSWNILAGFPGESPDEYRWMAGLIPFLEHLKPPCSCSPVRLDRFSPLFDAAAESGVTRVRPTRAYYYVYPLGRRELGRLAYFFDFDYADGRTVADYLEPTTRAVNDWQAAWARPGLRGSNADDGLRGSNADDGLRGPNAVTERPQLDARIDGDTVVVTDTRRVATAGRHVVTGLAAKVLLHGDERAGWGTIGRDPELAGREGEVAEALDALEADGLVARRGSRFVTLAVFRDRRADEVGSRSRFEDNHASDETADDEAAHAAPAQPLLRLGRSA